MSRQVATFRDHCRAMVEAEHRPDCASLGEPRYVEPEPGYKGPLNYLGLVKIDPPSCGGCVTDDERALWDRLAVEATTYLIRVGYEPDPADVPMPV